jgi:hypothetical protein
MMHELSLPHWTFNPPRETPYPFLLICRRSGTLDGQDSDGQAAYADSAPASKASVAATMRSMQTSATNAVASIIR